MSEALNEFLIGLAGDPDRAARFIQNPTDEVEGTPLSPEEKAALIMRDGQRIRGAMGGLRLETNESTQSAVRKKPHRRRHKDKDKDKDRKERKRKSGRRRPGKKGRRKPSRKR